MTGVTTLKYTLIDNCIPDNLEIHCLPTDIRSWVCKLFHNPLTRISFESNKLVLHETICHRCDYHETK